MDTLNEPTTNPTYISASTNTGKLLQLPIATVKHPPQPTSQCKRNHSSITTSLTKIPTCPTQKFMNHEIARISNYADGPCLKKESFSCDSIVRTSQLSIECNDKIDLISPVREASLSAKMFGHRVTAYNESLLSITSSDMEDFDSFSHTGNDNGKTACNNSPMIALSKSETNISEQNRCDGDDTSKLQIFNVVSLNDLHEDDPFLQKPNGDLSKNQCLTLDSDENCGSMRRKKHNMKLTNTITVAMRNTADVSDKTF